MVSLQDIQTAATCIRDHVIRTPLVHSPSFSRMFGGQVYLKLENLQKTGSFKIRGATYKLMTRLDQIEAKGVVAASAGNHAQGVALAARQAGVTATIVMPEWASISKQEATKGYGGHLIIKGTSLMESLEYAQLLAQEGRTLLHPFDDPDIIAGQGTIAIEVLEELLDPDIVLVPVGGGGLIGGIATATKAIRPNTRVIGVQAAACPSAHTALQVGDITRVEAQPSIADGIAVKQVGAANYRILRQFVDEVVLVEEAQIAAAILMLLEWKKVLAEGSGAVCLAALLSKAVKIPTGSKVVLVISGGNLDSPLLGRIINQGLIKSGRIVRLRVRLDDRPGALAGLLGRIAQLKANVLHIFHDRNDRRLPIYVTRVDLELETRGSEHGQAVYQDLRQSGYDVMLN